MVPKHILYVSLITPNLDLAVSTNEQMSVIRCVRWGRHTKGAGQGSSRTGLGTTALAHTNVIVWKPLKTKHWIDSELMKRELCDALQDSFFIIIPNPLKRRMSKNVNHFGDYWHFLKDKKHRYFSKFPLLCSADEIQVFNDMRVSEIIFHLCVNLSLYNISSQYEVQSFCFFSSFFTNGMKMRWKVRKICFLF